MVFTHGGLTGTEINIYKCENGIIEGTFFTKQKPTVGDEISRLGAVYVINEILENRDERIQKECTHNPKLAFFKLAVSIKQ